MRILKLMVLIFRPYQRPWMDDLFVFDGNCKPDKVNRITIDYHRVTRIKPKQPVNDNIEYIHGIIPKN